MEDIVVVECGKRNRMVKKHEEFRVQMSKLEDIEDHRLVNSCLIGLSQSQELDCSVYYEVDLRNYAEKCCLNYNDAYENAKLRFASLLTSMLIIRQDKFTKAKLATTTLSAFKYDDDYQTIAVKFNQEAVGLISGYMLKGHFNYYDSRVDLIGTSKKYILAEYLQSKYWQLKKNGAIKVSVPKLREELNMGEQYSRRTDFINKFIKPTLQELESIRGDRLTVTRIRNMLEFTGEINTIN